MGYKEEIPMHSEGIEIKLGGSSIPIKDQITFSVDDIGVTVTELKKKGVKFTLEPIQLESGMKLASFKDPNNVLIELVEHPKQSITTGQVRCNCDRALNREETLSVPGLKTSSNTSDVNKLLDRKEKERRDPRVPVYVYVLNMRGKPLMPTTPIKYIHRFN